MFSDLTYANIAQNIAVAFVCCSIKQLALRAQDSFSVVDTVFFRDRLLVSEPEPKGLTSRRKFIATIAALWQAAVLRADEHDHVSAAVGAQQLCQFSFFSKEQRKTVQPLMERIIRATSVLLGRLGEGR